MGLLLGGGSACSQHPLLQHGHSRSTSSCASVPRFAHKGVPGKKKKDIKSVVMAHLEKSRKDEACLRRRAVLLVGVSAFPLFLRFGAVAAETAARGEPVVFRHGVRERRLVQRKSDEGVLVPPSGNGETEMQIEIQTPRQTQLQTSQIAKSGPQEEDNRPRVTDSNAKLSSADAVSSLKQNQGRKSVNLEDVSENQLLSLLNAAGICGSGVLGGLYAISQKDKADIKTKLESMESTLEEKEASITLLEKNFEERMSNEQGQHRKEIKKLKEEEYALVNQLASVNNTVSSLEQKLQSEKRSVEDFKMQLDQAQNCLLQANEEKKALEGKIKDEMDEIAFLQDRVTLLGFEIKDKEKNMETLDISFRGKELECKSLNSSLNQIKSDYENASSAVEQSTAEIMQIKQELNTKNHLIEEFKEKFQLLSAEKDDVNKKLCILQNDYHNLKVTSAKKAESDSELLSKKTDAIRQLEQKLQHALDEAKKKNSAISSLNKEKDYFKVKLEGEMNRVTNLQNEIHIIQQSLKDSKLESSNLSNQLRESEIKFKQLEVEYSRIQDGFSEKQKSLISEIDGEKSVKVLLSNELATVRNKLEEMQQELFTTSADLKTALVAHETLQKELLEVYQKAETVSHDLKEERRMVDTLRKELGASGEEFIRECEARRALERDVTEAKKSLSEFNDRTMSLSRELESANSRVASLEEERELIHKTLKEQKDIAKEAQENIEDAQNLIVKLGAERESLHNRAKKLEGELATAKGEILRLRRQISLSKESLTKNEKNANGVRASTSSVSRKGNVGRKGGGNTQESSQ